MGKWFLFFFVPFAVFALEGEIQAVRSPDSLVLVTGETVQLAGIIPPAEPLRYQAVMELLTRKLVKQPVEFRADTLFQKSQKPLNKKAGMKKPKAKTLYGYVFFICDTCGLSSVAPEFKGQLMVTTHSSILLNSWLIERGWCTADTSLTYEKKNYYRFLESQAKPSVQ